MKIPDQSIGRRSFIKASATTAASLTGISLAAPAAFAFPQSTVNPHIIGPLKGYSPQIGTLVSMMNWMRMVVLSSVQGMDQQELDYLHDSNSNTIGAMLLHLAATEIFYQGNTFEGRTEFSEAEKKRWSAAMELGDEGRNVIKGNDLKFYLDNLKEVRERTLAEFSKRDDEWLAKVDPRFFGNQPTNNYCKWFHVCEHESNHNGQIKWIRGRIPA
jgi:hypothetical protein